MSRSTANRQLGNISKEKYKTVSVMSHRERLCFHIPVLYQPTGVTSLPCVDYTLRFRGGNVMILKNFAVNSSSMLSRVEKVSHNKVTIRKVSFDQVVLSSTELGIIRQVPLRL